MSINTARDLNRPSDRRKSSTVACSLVNADLFPSLLLASPKGCFQSPPPTLTWQNGNNPCMCFCGPLEPLKHIQHGLQPLVWIACFLAKPHKSGLKAGWAFISVSPSDHSSNSTLSLETVEHRVIKLSWSTRGNSIKDNVVLYEGSLIQMPGKRT